MNRGGMLTVLIIVACVSVYALLSLSFEVPTEEVQKLWTCLGVAGAIVTAANLIDSWVDLTVLRTSGRNGELEIVAKSGIRQDAFRLTQMLIVIGVGVLALEQGPVLTQAQRDQLNLPTWTAFSIILTAGIATIVAIAVLQAILDRRDRLMFYSRQGVRRSSMKERRDA